MRLHLLALASVVIAPVLPESRSSAAIIQVLAAGTVADGVDGAGLFGTAASDLAGHVYQATFDIDTSKGYVTGGSEYRSYTSVLHSAAPVPAITARITVDGTSYLVDGLYGGVNRYVADEHTDLNSLFQDVSSRNAELSLYDGFEPVYPNAPGADFPVIFHDPNLDPMGFSVDLTGFANTEGSFVFTDGGTSTNLDLDLHTVTYNVLQQGGGPTSFVPEPATWSLMLAGLGLVGASFRRRRQGQTAHVRARTDLASEPKVLALALLQKWRRHRFCGFERDAKLGLRADNSPEILLTIWTGVAGYSALAMT